MGKLGSGKPQIGQSEENVAAIRKAFDLSKGKSIWRASSELNIRATFILKIFRRELTLFSYKIQVAQKLETQDYNSQMEMRETVKSFPETLYPGANVV